MSGEGKTQDDEPQAAQMALDTGIRDQRLNREHKRANEILKRAASFFEAELDRQHKR